MGRLERHAAAELRVAKALRHIESAQNELDQAAQELSAIIGGSRDYDKARRLRESVRGFWYALNRKDRSTWALDREPDPP